MKTQHISDDMLIGDILSRYPESAQIMEDFGLHCTSCSVNAFEPVKMGAMSHGISEETANDMMARLNELANARHTAHKGLYVSARAAEKIMEFATAEGKEGWALQIRAHNNDGLEPAYAMDFKDELASDESEEEFHGVRIFLDKESQANLKGADVDYLDTQFGSGFKITNPQFTGTKKEGCCGGGGGCGSGGCGCGKS